MTCTTGWLPKQVVSAWDEVIRLSLPNDVASRKVNSTPQAAERPTEMRTAA